MFFVAVLLLFNPAAVASAEHILIADTNNHRVIEIDTSKSLTWQLGTLGVSKDIRNHKVAGIPGRDEKHLDFPVSIERAANGQTLIAEGDGQRIIEAGTDGKILWQYPGCLTYPVKARYLKNGHILITELLENEVIEVTRSGDVAWSYGEGELDKPKDASRLNGGNTLIADSGNHRVIEVNPRGEIVWQFGKTDVWWVGGAFLHGPSSASRLANNNTIITDTDNARIIEVDAGKNIIWQYGGSVGCAPGQLNSPQSAERLPGGRTLIVDKGNHRVIIVDKSNNITWQYGDNYNPGFKNNQLQFPMDARMVKTEIKDPMSIKVVGKALELKEKEGEKIILLPVALWAMFCVLVVFGLYGFSRKRPQDEREENISSGMIQSKQIYIYVVSGIMFYAALLLYLYEPMACPNNATVYCPESRTIKTPDVKNYPLSLATGDNCRLWEGKLWLKDHSFVIIQNNGYLDYVLDISLNIEASEPGLLRMSLGEKNIYSKQLSGPTKVSLKKFNAARGQNLIKFSFESGKKPPSATKFLKADSLKIVPVKDKPRWAENAMESGKRLIDKFGFMVLALCAGTLLLINHTFDRLTYN